MGEPVIYCPLCCNDTFKSRQDLFDHLFQISSNLNCPVCSEKFSSLDHLIGHIKDDSCVFVNPVETLFEADTLEINKKSLDDTNIKLLLRTNDVKIDNKNLENHISSFNGNNGDKLRNDKESSVEKMYVEVQLMKQCHDTQEIKLVKEDGQERYVIYTEDPNLNSDITIVTKQNNDGTISLTTMKDTNDTSEADGKLDDKIHTLEDPENELETESKNQEEVYSCNTCGVSFSSVLEHIQNYHNNQDVVVEEPLEDSDSNIPIEYKSVATEEVCDKQTSRRMITDTGDIIEAPLVQDNMVENQLLISIKEETMEKQDQRYTMRYVQSQKFSNSMTKEIKPIDSNNGKLLNCHKVVLKELQTTSGDIIKVYNCMSCNVYVSSLSEFKNHPCKVLKYSCPECPIAYENSKSLCAHMKVHKTKSTEVLYEAPTKFECEICSTIFKTSKSLKLHKRMHDPIKARPIEPPVETPEGIAASDDKYVCSICDKLIPIDYRAIHQNSHKSSNKMNCDICNKKFHSQEYLDMHMSVHNMDKVTLGKQDKSLPYMCLYCNRKFARPHEKVKHERIHTGEKPHECEICGKAFRVSYCLTLHMRTHTGARPYACPHCNKRFKAHSVYNHHLLTHSEVRAYKCPFCPKAFKTSVQLAGHKNSHTKPFSCQHCNRPFASLYAVRVHMEIHSRQNSLKFSCNMCGASYARAFALKDHVKQVHKQEMDNSDNLGEVIEAATFSSSLSLLSQL